MTQETHPYHKDATIFFLLVAAFVVGVIVLFLFFALKAERVIGSYEDCIASKTSRIQESYPQVCVSAGGKRFVDPTADRKVPPTEPDATPVTEPVSISLPNGWREVEPDLSVVVDDDAVMTHEFASEVEDRSYPLGRVTLQYSAQEGRFTPPDSVFEPETEVIGGISYRVVTGEENGIQYRVYYGEHTDPHFFVRIFTRGETAAELDAQKQVVAGITFPPLTSPTPGMEEPLDPQQ